MTEWKARSILKDICDPERRRAVLVSFWNEAEPEVRDLVAARLARNVRFREETLKKATPEKKAELLATQLHVPEFQEPLEISLMVYHTSRAKDLLAAFLDFWKIEHVNGSIETDDYRVPSAEDVGRAVQELRGRFDLRDIVLYLATAGLLMGGSEPKWREATWPHVERLMPELRT
jgi:hypothetical protein